MIRKWFSTLDQRYARPCAYVAVTALIAFCLGMALWHASGLVAVIWDYICLIMGPMVYGAMISYLLQPVVNLFSRGLMRRRSLAEHQQRRMHLAVILTIVALAIVLALIVVFALLVATRSFSGISTASFQNLLEGTQFDLAAFISTIEERLKDLGLIPPGSELSPMTLFDNFSGVFTLVMLSAVFGVYFLFDGDRAAQYGYSLIRATAGDRVAIRVASFLQEADRVFSGFVRGQFIDALMVGVLMTVALQVTGIPYAPFVGVIVGVANIIPFAGGPVGYALVALVCYTEQTMGRLIIGIVAVTVVMFIDGNFISPRLLANTLTFHPMLVLVALVSGSAVGGIAGMLVAVPLFAFLKLQLDHWLDRRLRRMDKVLEDSETPEDTEDPEPTVILLDDVDAHAGTTE